MPFVQRVVQPVYLARPLRCAHQQQQRQTDQASGSVCGVNKFRCIPAKCNNINNINNINNNNNTNGINEYVVQEHESVTNEERDDSKVTRTQPNESNGSPFHLSPTKTKTVAALVHRQPATIDTVDFANGTREEHSVSFNLTHSHSHTNGFAASFCYGTDNEDEPTTTAPLPPPPHFQIGMSVGDGSGASALLPMKKLKQHVEFLSTTTSPTSSPASPAAKTGSTAARGDGSGDGVQVNSTNQSRQQQQQQQHEQHFRMQQTTAASKIIPGFEFDSISNITLSNALRQLASLVLLASDIFDELHQELQYIGDRSCVVQRKIIAVEKKVCAFDPKMVTVPESDLLTFAQRKAHYDCDKTVRKELFTAETRPHSLKVLYDDAGKLSPSSTATASFASNVGGGIGANEFGTGASMAAGSDELVCTPVFGKANRKMRTRIDAEIEIRLPAAIEDLRKWTSSEALGDVTVTPDCMHHVDTSISTSVVIGDNGVLTPALSPSVISADAVDDLYSINISAAHDNSQIPNDINKDVPLNHRLPSPEEQIKIIALRYPAEVVSVDTSGKRFQRMCLARKSTTACGVLNIAETNNLNDDVQTVSRRSRSRKVRGKRRNTIAGTDQKEIQDAANGDSTATSSEIKNALAEDAAAEEKEGVEEEELMEKRSAEKSKKFGRSKSSDVLKKDTAILLSCDKGKNTLTRLNSLKLWGRNRFKFMQRIGDNASISSNGVNLDVSNGGSLQIAPADKFETHVTASDGDRKESRQLVAVLNGGRDSGDGSEIDSGCPSHHRTGEKKSEGRFSHERKPSYSSSEKSITVSSSGHLKGKLHLATCGGNVKLRDTSSLNRQRRNGITANDLNGKDEQPHSSSGNWSASSESGRASIGSEITIQPKSSASNTSLNVSSFHPGSGPPSSMLSRRRFLNTSASSSVTSEGTATPDLQVAPVVCESYSNHLDDETSSAYSCDTEGYYTSFHMDSGLRTLKEEEPPITPLQCNQTGSYSFGNQTNQTVLSAENEYELYGRGSTSTTTSSAGTVCTTLMVNDQNNLNAGALGPEVPERSSSLNNGGGIGGGSGGGGKLNRGNHSNSNSTSTLERSYSSSTIGSTLERTGTIKRNVNANMKLALEDVDGGSVNRGLISATPDSQDEGLEKECRVQKRSAQALPLSQNNSALTELEYSECSDLEGVERIERIKQKTALNAKRIPSMCIITPTTSDDENQAKDTRAYQPKNEQSSSFVKAVETTGLQFKINEVTGYCTIDMDSANARETAVESLQNVTHPTEQIPTSQNTNQQKDYNLNVLPKRGTQYGFNHMLEKLKVVLPNIKRSPSKSSSQSPSFSAIVGDDELYDAAGEYVTIADISNNNRHIRHQQPKAPGGLGIYYSNDIVRRPRHDDSASSAAEEKNIEMCKARSETIEYISLNELPHHLRRIAVNDDATGNADSRGEGVCKQNSSFIPSSRQPNKIRECAESDSSQSVPMYAEITEQNHERPPISPVAQNKGSRIKLNAQGKIIYDSDSLKRRRGAYTTFAPGPYVKETESAFAESTGNTIIAESDAVNSESGHSSNAAKLLLLNAAGITTRNTVKVRPIAATNTATANVTATITSNRNSTATIPQSSASPIPHPVYERQSQSVPYPSGNYAENKNLLINRANLATVQTGGESNMLPSPSTKSTSSTGSSTISSTNSTNTLVSASSSSSSVPSSITSAKEEASQHFYKSGNDQAQRLERNSPVYWTLQNRKHPRNVTADFTCRDDLYATPIRRSERAARAAATVAAANQAANISPIVPRNRSSSVGFLTSTPNKSDEQQSTSDDSLMNRTRAGRAINRNSDWDSPERLNTCADRIGHSKTSLMDFKKLLLAKSVRSNPVQKKISAVELLKKSTVPNANGVLGNDSLGDNGDHKLMTSTVTTTTTTTNAASVLNSSMKVLDLSGSPKTFANRRMLRQGQFGSPSKSFASKQRISPGGGWRSHNVVQRTDIMSTTIPEVNSEEDQYSANSSGSKTQTISEEEDTAMEKRIEDKFSIKQNFFLQNEENNFMRGELKKQFVKANLIPIGQEFTANDMNKLYDAAAPPLPTNNFITKSSSSVLLTNQATHSNNNILTNKVSIASHVGGRITPALETAL